MWKQLRLLDLPLWCSVLCIGSQRCRKRHNYGESFFSGPGLQEAAVIQYAIEEFKLPKNMLHRPTVAAESYVTLAATDVMDDKSIALFALPSALPYQQLRANLIRWSRSPQSHYSLHQAVFLELNTQLPKTAFTGIITRLLETGALPGTNAVWSCRLPSLQVNEREALRTLVTAGLVAQEPALLSADHDTVELHLTRAGAASVGCYFALIQPVPVLACMTFREAKAKDVPR